MKEFYQNLKARRLEEDISLEDIHRTSRLPMQYLQAIEEGRLESLPVGYERIYLRRYVQEIGLDSDEVLRDFDLLTGRLTASEHTAPSEDEADEATESSAEPAGPGAMEQHRIRLMERLNLDRIHKVFWISLAVLVVGVTGYITYEQYVFEKTNQQLEFREITISELIDTFQKEDSALTPEVTPNTALESSSTAEVRVELQARERTWLREIRDNTDTTEYILPAGMRHAVEAGRTVKFLVGRADGVEIWLNGDSLGILGRGDQVITSLVLTTAGITEQLMKTVEKKDPATEERPPAPAAAIRDTIPL